MRVKIQYNTIQYNFCHSDVAYCILGKSRELGTGYATKPTHNIPSLQTTTKMKSATKPRIRFTALAPKRKISRAKKKLDTTLEIVLGDASRWYNQFLFDSLHLGTNESVKRTEHSSCVMSICNEVKFSQNGWKRYPFR